MEKVIEVLKSLGAEYHAEGSSVEVESVGGSICEHDGFLYFVHGNQEPCIPVDSPFIEDWVKAYLGGFDGFAEFLCSFTS